MNAALSMWALVLGGWAMPATDDWTPPEQGDVKINVAQPADQPTDQPTDQPDETPVAAPPLDHRARALANRLPMTSLGNAAARKRALRPQVFPMAPTDPMAGMSEDQQMPAPPTSASPSGDMGGAQRPGYVPFAAQRSSRGQTGRSTFGTATSAYPSTVSNGERPFANYRLPPPVSPYMNIYRAGTDNGTIDNYTTVVRPQLEQNSYNAVNTTDVNGLQGNVQQLNQEIPGQPGSVAPGYFINYQQYYPNSGNGGAGNAGGSGGGGNSGYYSGR